MSGKSRYGAAETAVSRYETWRRGFDRMVIILGAMTVITGLCVPTVIYFAVSQPEPVYFATREDGGILPLTPISQPFLTDSQVTNFAVEAITRSLTIDFANWRRDLSESSRYFVRPSGWENYLAALERSGVLEFIKNRRLVSTAVANGASIIRKGLNEKGVYTWLVQVPMTVTYESSSESSKDDLIAEIQISRVPTWEMTSGIGISLVVVKPGRATP